MKIMVKLGHIDMFGYNGRDYHPEARDAGEVGQLLETHVKQDDSSPWDDLDYILVLLADGRKVQVVEHEIEAIHYGDPDVKKLFGQPSCCEGCESEEDYTTKHRTIPWRDTEAYLCDACLESDKQDSLEEADRKMGDVPSRVMHVGNPHDPKY